MWEVGAERSGKKKGGKIDIKARIYTPVLIVWCLMNFCSTPFDAPRITKGVLASERQTGLQVWATAKVLYSSETRQYNFRLVGL